MTMLKVQNFTISIDGYGAGPKQSTKNPWGEGGEKLHEWLISTRTFKALYGKSGGMT